MYDRSTQEFIRKLAVSIHFIFNFPNQRERIARNFMLPELMAANMQNCNNRLNSYIIAAIMLYKNEKYKKYPPPSPVETTNIMVLMTKFTFFL
jgi:hypothetical protein